MLSHLAKTIVLAGLIVAGIGIILMFLSRFNIPLLGKLPGDILIRKKNFIIYLPLTTSVLLSIILSVVLYFFFRK